MSWSGPVAGTAPYQSQPFSQGQPGYGPQQPFQSNQQLGYNPWQTGASFSQNGPSQRPPDSRPPKKKGNPIITRYPPPPGYRGPAQPQPPFGSNQYPAQYQPSSQQGFSQGPQPPTGWPQGYSGPQGYGPPQGHSQPPAYSQPGFPQVSNYQWPQQSYPQNQAYSQPQSYQPNQSYTSQQNSYQGYPSQPSPIGPNQQSYGHAVGWQAPPAQATNLQDSQYNSYGPAHENCQNASRSTPLPTPIATTLGAPQNSSLGGQPDSATSEHDSGEKPQLSLALDDWDFDFEGAIWPKSNDPVDPNLSLGVIIWRPAKQVTRALPSTHTEAEEQALKPPADKLGNGESVSIYFAPENSHEAFLDVRQTDYWEIIQNDPVFVHFTEAELSRTISLEDCVAMRERLDVPVEEFQSNEDADMKDSSWNVMDNLEQALSGHEEDPKPPSDKQDSVSSRRQSQEDVLAMLGVTGAPKPPSSEAMPFPHSAIEEKPNAALPEKPPAPPSATIPPKPQQPSQPPQRAHSYGGHRSALVGPPPRPYGSMSSSLHTKPSVIQERQQRSTWNPSDGHSQSKGHSLDGTQESPTGSESSHRTLNGSDLEPTKLNNGNDDIDTGPMSQLKRSDSSFTRKRNYENIDQDGEKPRQQDDHMRRKRRSQVISAYSRR